MKTEFIIAGEDSKQLYEYIVKDGPEVTDVQCAEGLALIVAI